MTVLTAFRARRARPVAAVREAVVLSGGGSLGAAQAGALRALLEGGVRPDVLVGCSAGALNAAFLAVDPTPQRADELEWVWRGLAKEHVFGPARRLATQLVSVARGGDHLYDSRPLQSLVRRWVPLADLRDTAVPCHVVTTDLRTGAACWWSEGDPVSVLTASACLPAVFAPVALGGSLHVDGGVVCPVPVERALDLGAARVWVIDVTGGALGRTDERMNALDVLLMSFAISRSHLDRVPVSDRPAQRVVRLPKLDVGRLELRDFSRTGELIEEGYAAGRAAVQAELARAPQPRRAPAVPRVLRPAAH